LKFYASVRVDIRRTGTIKAADGTALGNTTKIKMVKNKVAPPFTEAEFDIMFNEGISRTGSLIDLGTQLGVLEKKGAWISFEGKLVGQGRDATKEELKNNEELYKKIEAAVLAKVNAPVEEKVKGKKGAPAAAESPEPAAV
jgi:recombination protein RecA